MTELEKLRRHMKYFRRFALNTKTVVMSGKNHKTVVSAIRGDVQSMENQWPNWLDDDIEAMPDESDYPECEKMEAVREKSQAIGEFIEWLQSKNIYLLTQHEGMDDDFCFSRTPIEELLAEFFGIDLAKAEKEKSAMLEDIRKQNDPNTA